MLSRMTGNVFQTQHFESALLCGTCLGLSVFVLAYYEQKSIFYFLKNSRTTTVKECVIDKQGRKDAGGRPGKPNNVAPLQTEIL